MTVVEAVEELTKFEESILTGLIERAQYPLNPHLYSVGHGAKKKASLFDLRLYQQEKIDARFGGFLFPEEIPFHSRLPKSRYLHDVENPGFPVDKINLTQEVRADYLAFLPRICEKGSRGKLFRSLEQDMSAVKAIARRIHYGTFYVAEAKLQSDPESLLPLIERGDREELQRRIVRTEVEEEILERVRRKTDRLQAEIEPSVRRRVDTDVIVLFFRDTVIRLTKLGEIRYLLARDRELPP